jgi:hypothetical protein
VRRRRLVTCLGLILIIAWAAGCGGEGKGIQKEIELILSGGALPAEQRVIRVGQGDEVILRWTTDRAVAVHLHGYDIEKALAPGTPATMWFVARATGRFPITRHHGPDEVTLGYLEVHPR